MADGDKAGHLRGTATACRDALAGWLQQHAVAPAGPGRLAVVACREADGRALLGYPEIAGYYLGFLAAGGLPPSTAAPIASAVAAWLRQWLARDGCTRPALTGTLARRAAAADWRNRLQFLFDDAILLGGLARVRQRGLLHPAATAAVEHALHARLLRLLDDDGQLRAAISHDGSAPPPRWSTRRGAFLLKAVAALQRAATPLPPALCAAVDRLLAAHHPPPPAPHPECTHASLYAHEGALLLAKAGQAGARPSGATCLALLPELAAPRHDQAAQWLRLALLAGFAATAAPVQTVVERLCRAQCSDGGLPFADPPGDARSNTWCALFAWQALDWWCRALDGAELEEEMAWLI